MNAVAVTPEQLAVINGRPPSVAHMFFDRVRQSADREAIRYPDADEKWHSLTWREVGDQVSRLAAGLVALGIEPGLQEAQFDLADPGIDHDALDQPDERIDDLLELGLAREPPVGAVIFHRDPT